MIETAHADKSGFSWIPTDADHYRVVRGLQANLANLINGSPDFSCYAFGPSTSVTITSDDPQLVAGRCYYYLIQGYNCGDPDLWVGPAGNSTAGARLIDTQVVCD